MGYLGDTEGQEYVLTWKPGGVLETTFVAQERAPIEDRAFAEAVLAIWLGEKPVQKDIKQGLVSRAPTLIR